LKLDRERELIVEYGQKLVSSGLTSGTGGNLSIFNRREGLIAVSPSGMDYFKTLEKDVVILDLEGNLVEGKRKPTSEKDLHLYLYRARSDVNAVIHVHSVFATTLASLGWEIPPISYLVALSGSKVPVAPYATYGTSELATVVTEYIKDFNAVLMANHGLVTVGEDLESGFNRAETVEFISQVYWRTRCVGEPIVLPEEEMARITEKFQSYGQRT